MAEIYFLNHASFLVKVNGKKILIDPYGILENESLTKLHSEIMSADYMLITHGHNDHLGDVASYLKLNQKIKVYCIHEVAGYYSRIGFPSSQFIGLNKGTTINLIDGISLTTVHADHSSQLPDGSYGGEAVGYIINYGSHHIYHSGDTAAFGDMKLMSDLYKIDIALLCIGGHYTMGPYEAGYAVNNLLTTVKFVIPMHYNSTYLNGSPDDLKTNITRKGVEVIVLKSGEQKVFE